jgi:FtsH ternary system domain X3-analog
MAEMTISLRCNPATGKKDIIVKLHSDADALPQEHEQMHRNLVDKLIHGGLLKAVEVGQLIVEREEIAQLRATPAGTIPNSDKHPLKSGN